MASTYINIPGPSTSGAAQNVNVVNIPLPVTVVTSGTTLLQYNEVLAVASGAPTQIVSYTVPGTSTASLQQIITSGQNIAQYTVTVNGSTVMTKRTYFGGNLNTEFNLGPTGFKLSAGDTVTVSVLHNRPATADFESTIQILLN